MSTVGLTGRPSSYNEEIAAAICTRIAAGESLRKICDSEGFPHRDTVHYWLFSQQYPIFSDQYAAAREAQMEYWSEEIVEIADEEPLCTVELKDGAQRTAVDNAGVNRNRLRVDSRKWLMSKLAPKKYGDNASLNVSGEVTINVGEILTRTRTAHMDTPSRRSH